MNVKTDAIALIVVYVVLLIGLYVIFSHDDSFWRPFGALCVIALVSIILAFTKYNVIAWIITAVVLFGLLSLFGSAYIIFDVYIRDCQRRRPHFESK